MLRSMTGFGQCTAQGQYSPHWEIRSVNSRHLDIRWHLPAELKCLEMQLEKIVRNVAHRGRLEISVTIQYPKELRPNYFDQARANAMLDDLQKFVATREDAEKANWQVNYNILLQIPYLWSEVPDAVSEKLQEELSTSLELALKDWDESRIAEGKSLARDLSSRILRLQEWTELLQRRSPEILEERITNLHERIENALAAGEDELDSARFLQEIIILADKLDVSEELTRLNTHLESLREFLADGIDVGRRLDFTLQECFREINTCGNKLPDVQLSRLVVDFKNELEKCREQVQNLE